MKTEVNRKERRAKRHLRSRTSIVGTAERPRLSVFASLRHVTAQIIDDLDGHTLVAAGTVEKEVADQCESGTGNTAAAAVVGKVLAERALAGGVEQVVFDRGGHKYHGRVRALAEAAREAGLRF